MTSVQSASCSRSCLGVGVFCAVIEVMLPQILPSLVAAFCLTSTVALGAYGTALALAGTQVNILPLVLYSKISETGTDLPAASAASLVLVAICACIVALGEAIRAGGEAAVDSQGEAGKDANAKPLTAFEN
ncbi:MULTISPECIES: hypothetical protein [unclassified Bradyrhizobium]|uniref:hypothetical protein n=1 Tax=unclassified Bradyrhizobium TaxID=2631580 RepID=UPI002011F44C|nr:MULTISPECIES: hypothetical protein [unclassified Bradyrhizobium]